MLVVSVVPQTIWSGEIPLLIGTNALQLQVVKGGKGCDSISLPVDFRVVTSYGEDSKSSKIVCGVQNLSLAKCCGSFRASFWMRFCEFSCRG